MDWHEGFQIYGENGSASAKIYNPWFYKSSDVELFDEDSATTTRVLGADGHFYRRQVEGFADSVLSGAPMRGADIADGVANIKTMVAIAHSVASGKSVEVASAKGALVVELGIFSRTYQLIGIDKICAQAAQDGYQTIQFNFSSAGLPSLPKDWPETAIKEVMASAQTERTNNLCAVGDL